jgi:hypothetical protein
MADSDEIVIGSTRRDDSDRPSDMTTLFKDITDRMHLKFLVFLFVLYLILHNDIFITRVLKNFNGAVDEMHPTPTTYGTILTGIILTFCSGALAFLMNLQIV